MPPLEWGFDKVNTDVVDTEKAVDTEEVLKDQEEQFTKFFKGNTCGCGGNKENGTCTCKDDCNC